jgi:hypothetical protein
MSMLNNLKKIQKNHVFLDDEDDMDIDNMDFPLPTNDGPSSSGGPFGGGAGPDMAQLQKMMQSMGGAGGLGGLGGLGGDAQRPAAAAPATRDPGFVSVAQGPDGAIRRMNPEQYKE